MSHDWNMESGSMGRFVYVGTFGPTVRMVVKCTKVRGQDIVKRNKVTSFDGGRMGTLKVRIEVFVGNSLLFRRTCILLTAVTPSEDTFSQFLITHFNPLFTHDALGQHKFDPIHLST